MARGRNKVKTTYTKVGVTPSKRNKQEIHPDYAPQMKTPKGLSPLAAYVEENLDTGISVLELIAQFQEYDCKHRMEPVESTSVKITFVCVFCAKVEVKFKPGKKE